ncbi:hypothetical protein GJ744_002558 [Endocarpon pusillum]|uniref:Uncharacterized protein n=1 Tax=Endocarpon pusillum TaxID=364733 RepID=A0A8H7E2L4_9EURO|nr:hypothetical protein GJ744_002558 [Endocarpon pusillum]
MIADLPSSADVRNRPAPPATLPHAQRTLLNLLHNLDQQGPGSIRSQPRSFFTSNHICKDYLDPPAAYHHRAGKSYNRAQSSGKIAAELGFCSLSNPIKDMCDSSPWRQDVTRVSLKTDPFSDTLLLKLRELNILVLISP